MAVPRSLTNDLVRASLRDATRALSAETVDQALRQMATMLNGTSAILERIIGQELASGVLDGLATGLAGEPCERAETVRAAIEEHGADAVREAALVLSYRSLCREAAARPSFALGAFRSGMAAAHLMRQFGFRTRLDPMTAFAAGLAHETGMILLAIARGPEYHALLDSLGGEKRETCDAERQQLGVDHRFVAHTALAEKGFPAAVVQAASDHHRPLEESTPITETIAMVALAVRQLGFGFGAANVPPDFAPEESGLLERMPGGIEKLTARVVAAVEAADRVWSHSSR